MKKNQLGINGNLVKLVKKKLGAFKFSSPLMKINGNVHRILPLPHLTEISARSAQSYRKWNKFSLLGSTNATEMVMLQLKLIAAFL